MECGPPGPPWGFAGAPRKLLVLSAEVARLLKAKKILQSVGN
jgi:hypothetical protein